MADSAAEMMAARKILRDGPYFTGNLTAKGVTVEEDDRETKSSVKRFTDRYIRLQKIGITASDYPQPCFLPQELQEFIGLTEKGAKLKAPSRPRQLNLNDIQLDENEDDKPTTVKDEDRGENEDDASGAEELEDEFEEFEDDDYNAEKYFDDGDDDGMGDDDDGEAAY